MTDRGYYVTDEEDEKVSSMYKDLGIPVGLYYMQLSMNDSPPIEYSTTSTKTEIIPDDLYDKLMALSATLPSAPKKYTKNNRNKQVGKKIKGKKMTRKVY